MPIIITGIVLILFGLLAIFSVSIHESFTLGIKGVAEGRRSGDPSNYFYFFRQLRNIVVAVIMAAVVYKIPMKFFQNNRNIIVMAAIIFILQLAVFLPEPIGATFNGARGRIKIGGLTTIQPAEFFKLGYILFMSSWLIRKRQYVNERKFFIQFIILNVILFFVFLLIPDLGTLFVLGLSGLVMLRYAGAKAKYVVGILIGGIIGGLVLGTIAGLISPRFRYLQDRFTYFLSSDVDPQSRQIGWQNQQALIAVGGGGFWGQGYGKGLQKFGYIPEAQSDFIFAAFSEEIGFIGNLILLGLYFYLARYFLTHLAYVKDPYSKMIGVGIISLIIIQMFVNIGVNVKILPNTGLTLPFISFGGTALMVNLIEIVLLYKIIKGK